MRSSIIRGRARGLAAFLAIATTLTLSAPPAAAADRPASHGKQARVSLAAATATHVAALRPAPAAFAQETPAAAASADSGSFFRTRTGVAAVVIMVAGAGFVAYSIRKDNEKVHSPIR